MQIVIPQQRILVLFLVVVFIPQDHIVAESDHLFRRKIDFNHMFEIQKFVENKNLANDVVCDQYFLADRIGREKTQHEILVGPVPPRFELFQKFPVSIETEQLRSHPVE